MTGTSGDGDVDVTDWPEIAGDARFFLRAGPFTLAAVADAAEADGAAARLLLAGVAPLQAAGPDQVELPRQPQIRRRRWPPPAPGR